MSVNLPLFSVPCVIFPGERIPFHIFEPRYLAMLSVVLGAEGSQEPREFGIVGATKEVFYTVGCAVTVSKVLSKNPDGSTDILTHGTRRFRVIEVEKHLAYPTALVEFFDDTVDPDTGRAGVAATLHSRLLEITTGKITVPLFEKGDQVSFQLGHNAGLTIHERQTLLEITSEAERLDYLIKYYRRVLPSAVANQELQERVSLNGHLRTLASIKL